MEFYTFMYVCLSSPAHNDDWATEGHRVKVLESFPELNYFVWGRKVAVFWPILVIDYLDKLILLGLVFQKYRLISQRKSIISWRFKTRNHLGRVDNEDFFFEVILGYCRAVRLSYDFQVTRARKSLVLRYELTEGLEDEQAEFKNMYVKAK